MFKKIVSPFLCTIPVVLLVACQPPAAEDDAPTVEASDLDEQDWGQSWGSWTMTAYGYRRYVYGTEQERHWGMALEDSSASGGTKGGGACLVNATGGSCTTDAQCGVATFPQYNYCYNNTCYQRPGHPATYCFQSSSLPAGSHFSSSWPYESHVLACMTKAGGPSANCGSTNSSLYMRHIGRIDTEVCDIGPYGPECSWY